MPSRYSGDYTDTLGHLQPKSGQNNNGYVPYVDYARDYSPPPAHNLATIRNGGVGGGGSHSNTLNTSSSHMNGQISGGNMSLTRNLRQDNGLPNVQGSLNSLQNGLLGKCIFLVISTSSELLLSF